MTQMWNKIKKNLIVLIEGVLNSIFNSVDEFPLKLKEVMSLVRQGCKDIFEEGDDTMPYTCISCFIFLRYFVAAILGPSLFGFTKERPSLMSERALTLVAKTIQNLANFCDFGAKESYLTPLNPFLGEQSDKMKEFLDSLIERGSRIRGGTQKRNEEEEIQKINPLKEMATLHVQLIEYLPAMRTEAQKDTKQKKLLTELTGILEGITRKVNDFREKNS
eukprot:CAMPEP_0201530672 /NCGR_PEP_ID=MMETSP0161_2-20130828/45411_1 /ASSEMBLY_ACC=CAM_ASM_000251 /TAXON_ID=180227 /ORGANISM="Neoparamoeba aestuarina, Strain SoJaBio B1-5/56/2" /LENGTH=218 /DNA_ID=CAMNT_0047933139 /DNA_START=56 /DNA_END=709 /DNA_ORIENTATION=-